MLKISEKTPVHFLDFQTPFGLLTPNEKQYAFNFTEASWRGALVVPFQICYEAPPMFILFSLYFKNRNLWQLKEEALKIVTEDEYKLFLAYAATFYANFSNYQHFGHNKFFPGIEAQKFWDIFRSNPEYS